MARFNVDNATASAQQSALSLRVSLDQYETTKDYKETSAKPQNWNSEKVFKDILAAKLRRTPTENSKLNNQDNTVQWPQVSYGHITYIYDASPVCTDAQVVNCSTRADPLVRNKTPRRHYEKQDEHKLFGAKTGFHGILPAPVAPTQEMSLSSL